MSYRLLSFLSNYFFKGIVGNNCQLLLIDVEDRNVFLLKYAMLMCC